MAKKMTGAAVLKECLSCEGRPVSMNEFKELTSEERADLLACAVKENGYTQVVEDGKTFYVKE